jgi:fumarate reductase subunit C
MTAPVEDLAAAQPILRTKDYGSVWLTVRENSHRYESRWTYLQTIWLIGAALALGAGSWTTWMGATQFNNPPTVVLSVVALGIALLLAGVWFTYFTLDRKSILVLTPDEVVLTIRGLFPFRMPGTRRWPLEKLEYVFVMGTPTPARIKPVVISGVQLGLEGKEDGEETFFSFETREGAEELRQDIVQSAREMSYRKEALLANHEPGA